MSAQMYYPTSGTQGIGALFKTRLANAKLRLWKAGINPNFGVTLAQLNAVECDFDGYPSGGISVGTWSNPILSPGQGSMIMCGLVSFAFDGGGSGIGNLVGGFYLVTSDDVLWVVGQFPDPVPVEVAGVGLPIALSVGIGST
jgi:hypothetical protein